VLEHAAMRRSDCGQDVPGFVALTADDAAQPIASRFARMVAHHGERLALRSPRARRTYAEIDRTSARIARALLARRGAAVESVVAFLDSDVAAAEAFLGVLRAGKRFVPIEPRLPDARAAVILEDSEATVALTDAVHRDRLARLAPAGVLVLDLDALDGSADAPIAAEPVVSLDAHAWIVYTSGSTGQPKGVLQNHGNLMEYVRVYADGFRISPTDRLASFFTAATNGGLQDLLVALGTGACLCMWDPGRDGMAALAPWLRAVRATYYHSVPTIFRELGATLDPAERFPDVRLVRLGGESSYRHDFEIFRRHFVDRCRLVHRLGSSETGPLRWAFLSRDAAVDGNVLPVGWDAPGVRTELVDEQDRPVAVGDVGEIVVRSRFLSPGYWQRPAETEAAFADDPEEPGRRLFRTGDLGRLLADGSCVLSGRKDSQVKVRGHRVELEEIEQALHRHPQVRDAVVVGARGGEDETRLIAYVVPQPGPPPTTTSLRQALAAALPAAMIPSAFVALDALPQAQNGKVNRRALPPPGTGRPALDALYREPGDDLERLVAGIWREVLEVDAVGADDPFLELGGDSLRAMRVMARLCATARVEIALGDLLEAATIADLARVLRAHRA